MDWFNRVREFIRLRGKLLIFGVITATITASVVVGGQLGADALVERVSAEAIGAIHTVACTSYLATDRELKTEDQNSPPLLNRAFDRLCATKELPIAPPDLTRLSWPK